MTEHYTTTAHLDDGFPVPELTPKERKQIFLQEFLKYLKACALVQFDQQGITYQMRYGQCDAGSLTVTDDAILFRDKPCSFTRICPHN